MCCTTLYKSVSKFVPRYIVILNTKQVGRIRISLGTVIAVLMISFYTWESSVISIINSFTFFQGTLWEHLSNFVERCSIILRSCYPVGFLSYSSYSSYSCKSSISFHLSVSRPRGDIISISMRCGWLSPSPLISISAFQVFSGIFLRLVTSCSHIPHCMMLLMTAFTDSNEIG